MLQSKNERFSFQENLEFIEKKLNQSEKTLNDKKHVTQSIIEIICQIDQSYQAKNSQVFIQALEKIQAFSNLDKFLDSSLTYLQLKLILSNNLSYFYQTQWKSNDNDINCYIKYVEEANDVIQIQKNNLQSVPFNNFFDELKLNYSLILNHMQLCAVYSHQKKNKKSLNSIYKVLEFMQEFVQNLKRFFDQEQHKLGFSRLDQIQMIQYFKEDEDLLVQILIFLDEVDKVFQKILQQNQQNNTKSHEIDLDSFTNNYKKFDTEWAKNMNIGYFVHSKYLSLNKLHHTLTVEEIFSESFFSLLILMVSCILFLLANETRIYCISEIGTNDNFKIRTLFQKTHVEKIKKTSQFILSSLLHERAIELLSCYYTDLQLQKNMIKIYEDNYKPYQNLDTIKEERESIQSTIFQQKHFEDCFVENKKLEKQFADNKKKLQILKMTKDCLESVKRQKSNPAKSFKKLKQKNQPDMNNIKNQNNSNINIFKNYIMIGDINQTIFKKNNFKINKNSKKKGKVDNSDLNKKKFKKKFKKNIKTINKKIQLKSPEKISSRLKKIFAEPNTYQKQHNFEQKKQATQFSLIQKYLNNNSNNSSKLENIKSQKVQRNNSKQFKKPYRRKSIQSVKNQSRKNIKLASSIDFKKKITQQSSQRYFKQMQISN